MKRNLCLLWTEICNISTVEFTYSSFILVINIIVSKFDQMLDWNTAVEPLLYNGGKHSSSKIEDVVAVADAIVENKQNILCVADDAFFSIYVALAGDFLSTTSSKLTKGNVQKVASACRILLEYCVTRLVNCESPSPSCHGNDRYINVVMCLCSNYDLPGHDAGTLTAMLRTVDLPLSVEIKSENETTEGSDSCPVGKSSLTTLELLTYLTGNVEATSTYKTESEYLLALNKLALEELALEHKMFASFANLSSVRQYSKKYTDFVQLIGKTGLDAQFPAFPNSVEEAHSLESGLGELLECLSLINNASILDINNPSNETQLQDHIDVVLTSLYIGISVAVSRTVLENDDEATPIKEGEGTSSKQTWQTKNNASTIVGDSVAIYESMAKALKESTSFGIHIYRNFQALASCLLLQGLRAILQCMNDRRKRSLEQHDTKKRNVFSLALSSLLIKQFQEILTSCNTDTRKISASERSVVGFDINQQSLPIQHFAFLSSQCDLVKFLVGSVYYTLDRVHQEETAGTAAETSHASEDDDVELLPASDDNSDTSEPDPVLGKNLLTIFACDSNTTDDGWKSSDKLTKKEKKKLKKNKRSLSGESVAPGNDAAGTENHFQQFLCDQGTLFYCGEVIQLLIDMLMSRSFIVQRYFSAKLTDLLLTKLFNILVIVDERNLVSNNEGVGLLEFFQKLLANKFLEENRMKEIEGVLIQNLFKDDPEKIFIKGPMQFSIYAQLLMRKQQTAKLASSTDDSAEALEFFDALLKKLSAEYTTEIGVEILQLACFIFQTFNKTNKNKYLIEISRGFSTWKKDIKEANILGPVRLCLLFEYILHNYHKIDIKLVDQVRGNLLNVGHLLTDQAGKTTRQKFDLSKKYIPFEGVLTSNSVPIGKQKDGYSQLIHYELRADASKPFEHDNSVISNEVSSVLTSLEDYSSIYSNMTSFLKVCLDFARNNDGKEFKRASVEHQTRIRILDISRYGFQIFWRLVLALPFSTKMENNVEMGDVSSAEELLIAVEVLTKRSSSDTPSDELVIINQLVQLTKQFFATHFVNDITPAMDLRVENFPSMVELLALDCLSRQLMVRIKKLKADANPYEHDMDLLILASNAMMHVSQFIRDHTHRSARRHAVSGTEFGGLESNDLLIANVNLGSLIVGLPATDPCSFAAPTWIQDELKTWKLHITRMSEFKDNAEDGVNETLSIHFKSFIMDYDDNLITTLILLQEPFFQLCDDILVRLTEESMMQRICSSIMPVLTTVKFNNQQFLSRSIDKIMSGGELEMAIYSDTACFNIVKVIYEMLTKCFNEEDHITDRYVACNILQFLNRAIDRKNIQRACRNFFTESLEIDPEDLTGVIPFVGNPQCHKGDLIELLYTIQTVNYTAYSNSMLAFMGKLCLLGSTSFSLAAVCEELKRFNPDVAGLKNWVSHFNFMNEPLNENDPLDAAITSLQNLSNFAASETSLMHPDFCTTLLQAILPVDENDENNQPLNSTFVQILITLANAHGGSGHPVLFRYALAWLNSNVSMFEEKDAVRHLLSGIQSQTTQTVSSCSLLLLYVADIMKALSDLSPDDDDVLREDGGIVDIEEEIENFETEFGDEDSFDQLNLENANSGNDVDELWNKLCTYIMTQKKFMNQHWYHCHTCKMIDGVGVCTICAKVCHKGHDISYAKHGSFFCDCGAKEPKVCKALVKRVPGSDKMASGVSAFSDFSQCTSTGNSTVIIQNSSQTSVKSFNKKENELLAAKASTSNVKRRERKISKLRQKSQDLAVSARKDELISIIQSLASESKTSGQRDVGGTVLNMLQTMLQFVSSDEYKLHSANTTLKAVKVMEELRNNSKTTNFVDTLLVPTLGSQEGAFENVKPNYTGDQGATIRQHVNNKTLRRVSMCCLAPSTGNHQYLAVSHEKGKVTLLQLSTLLKQADASKRKLTLTRLSTTSMPFTVVTLSANPSNDEVLAVCGLKDCHVLTFASSSGASTPSGSVLQHLVLHPQLGSNNYIIRAIWLPASPSMLAIITAEFIKIYDLAKDVLSPAYFFLIPTGKIRDTTFIGGSQSDKETYIITMSTTGYIYSQQLCEESLAVHGTFYMTNVLHVDHESVKEINGQQGSGGISVYYSHMLQLLFFSFVNGRNFAASLTPQLDSFHEVYPIEYKPNGSNMGNRHYPLFEWSEVPNHPGLVTCFSYSNSCPVVMMVEPDKIFVQEIKTPSSTKSKIQDMVAVRHNSSKKDDPSERTTVIVLFDDGSLRIFLASPIHSGFWLDPSLRPTSILGKRKIKKPVSQTEIQANIETVDGDVKLPIDFFEHSQVVSVSDLEFAGDLLQVYNKNQLKSRLNGHGTQVVFKSPYTLSIKIKNTNVLIAGIRLSLGSQGVKKIPNHIMIGGGRKVSFSGSHCQRERWFDIPLSRDESLKHQSELVLNVANSSSSDGTIVLDGLRVYCKSKESYGLPLDEGKGGIKTSGIKIPQENDDDLESDVSQSTYNHEYCDEILSASMLAMERLIQSSFRKTMDAKSFVSSLKTTSDLLLESALPSVRCDVKNLICLMFKSKKDFYSYQDTMLVKRAHKSFQEMDLDVETFQRMLLYISHIARKRPYNLLPPVKNCATDEEQIDWDELGDDFEIPILLRKQFSFVSKDFHKNLIEGMVGAFWRLLSAKPRNRNLAPPCLPGLTRVDITVRVLIDVTHAISACSPETLDLITDIYFKLLTHPNPHVSYAAKSALVRLLQNKSDRMTISQTITTIQRTPSKGTDTPPSTRSESPPSLSSAHTTSAASARIVSVASEASRIQARSRMSSSRATTGGTIDEDPDNVNFDEEVDEDEDDDEEEEEDHRHYPNIEESIDSDEQQYMDNRPLFYNQQVRDGVLVSGLASLAERLNDRNHVLADNLVNPQPHDDDDDDVDDDPADDDASQERRRRSFMARLQEVREARRQESSVDPEVERHPDLVESGTFNLDVMQAMADEAEEPVLIDEMDLEDQDIENVLLGQDEEAMMELAIALSLRQDNQAEMQADERAPNWADESVNEGLNVRLDSNNDESNTTVTGAPPTQYLSDSSEGSGAADTSLATPLLDEALNNESFTVASNAVGSVSTILQSEKTDEEMNAIKIGNERLAEIRISVLKRLFENIEDVEKVGGEYAIPYFQVVIMLIQTLDMNDADSSQLHYEIVMGIMKRLKSQCYKLEQESRISNQTSQHEVFLLMFRLLNVLMSKVTGESTDLITAQQKASATTTSSVGTNNEELFPIATTSKRSKIGIFNSTALILKDEKILPLCYHILEILYHDHWKQQKGEDEGVPSCDHLPDGNPEGLLRGTTRHIVADMSPFFLHQYSRSHAGEIFQPYRRLLTEMALHVAYQVRKQHVTTSEDCAAVFCQKWRKLLSDYMLFAGIPAVVRGRTRKLLLYITGSKDKYREERDTHALKSYMQKSSELCNWTCNIDSKATAVSSPLNLSYDDLIELVESVKKWNDIARSRPLNWQKFCFATPECLQFLLYVSVYSDENVATIALKLLLSATSAPTTSSSSSENLNGSSRSGKKPSKSSSKDGKVRESKSKDQQQLQQQMLISHKLSTLLLNGINDVNLSNFVRHFLLEMNTTSMRWSAHSLVLNLFKNTPDFAQLRLLSAMWSLWPYVTNFGKKSAQFVDLLGYLSLKSKISESDARLYADAALKVLHQANRLVCNHHNAILYSQLSVYVNFDGYYLENNPCMVCNQIESPFSTIKLPSIRSEIRYTTTQLITKLVGSYAVQKCTIKITDIKRTKMIRTAILYYNNKKVSAIVDLKNKPAMWNKAKSITVPQGESDIVFDLPLPVVATNLMIEFSDFYENISASMETLQCPRCSASVQANPGVCGNCGENVFQCHKCRSINYDEKDPFLCNMCGFSKYGKFEVSFKARSCCAVDTIDNDEGRKKMVENIVSLLGKADSTYTHLSALKPQLETLLFKISSASYEAGISRIQPTVKGNVGGANGNKQSVGTGPGKDKTTNPPITFAAVAAGTAATSHANSNQTSVCVNSNIQQLAKKYCQDCKGMFDELANVVRTVLASRNEILEYDRRQRIAVGGEAADGFKVASVSSISCSQSAPDCYGCASAIAEQCITLLRVLAINQDSKPHLIDRGVVQELVAFNMKRGQNKTRKQVHSLIGQLVKNNPTATCQLNSILFNRITSAIKHHGDDLPSTAVASEMQLLTSMLSLQDDLWQMRLRTVMHLFQSTVQIKSPSVVENVTLPCLHIIRSLISMPKSKEEYSVVHSSIDFKRWMSGDKNQDFSEWKKLVDTQMVETTTTSSTTLALDKDEVRELYLQTKYVQIWRDNIQRNKCEEPKESELMAQHPLLRSMLFCPSSKSVRQAACSMISSLSQISSRKSQVLDLLTSFLEELSGAGEAANEFMTLYQEQIRPIHSKVYLVARGVLPPIGCLIQKEIKKLSDLEETTLNLNLQQGYALKELTELLFELAQEVPHMHVEEKRKLVRIVLDSYLSLRRLVLQRTNLVDSAQELMLVLLEDLTGTEGETRSFMALCIDAIKKQDLNDHQTPQFIFERLANIICPEETDTSEFFLSLDKCPLQEDFLQGRMVGNPYSSNAPGLGPLMRDVKNKICRDCDLIALLEDDSGMELLVNNKIISLDLPVRDVYKKVWLVDHAEDDAMHVVYRMRGLLGEATEDMVERLSTDKAEDDEEKKYRLASVLGECGGIEVTLQRLESVKNVKHGRQLIDVILKLLSYAVKLKSNRQYLARPSVNTLSVLLGTLLLGLEVDEDGVAVVEQILDIMWSVLYEAAQSSTEGQSELTGDKERLTLLLPQIDSEFVQSHPSILQGILKIIPFLSFGDADLMQMLIDHFIGSLDFEKYDEGGSDDNTVYLNCFCDIVAGIQVNANGDQLKDLMIENNIVGDALAYIDRHTPSHKNFESDDWRKFTQRKGIPLCLRMLTGLCTQHERTQALIGDYIPGLHRIEQISSEEGIGTHAENVLEKSMEHPEIERLVKQVRRETRAEKKRKAMKVREKELGALGMHTNSKGQVLSKSCILTQMTELVEETGLTCIICREGYKYEPKKVLGIYTYTRRCALEEYENKSRKQQGYSSVSHFNVVHYDCHTSAVRSARGREEWDSALLQNANTKCNGLLPLWGPQVPESAFASCLARHNTYIQEATSSQREPSIQSTIHDLKLLLLRFSNEKSFSEETGGGGKQSNINLIPYLIHAGVYVINTTRIQVREERTMAHFLSIPKEKWVESAYDVEGPLFHGAMMCFLSGKDTWKENRAYLLRRILVICQARKESKVPISTLKNTQVLEFEVYKPYLLYWALLDTIINVHFKFAPDDADSAKLAYYIRHNDAQLLEQGEKTLRSLQDGLIPCTSGNEVMDVLGLLGEIQFDEFIQSTLRSVS